MLKGEYAGRNMRGADLRKADLTDQILFGADFRDSKLVGAKVSMACHTFDGLKLDDRTMASLLVMISLADAGGWGHEIRNLVCRRLGADDYERLMRALKLT